MMISFSAMAFTEGWALIVWLTVMNISLSVAFPLALVLTSSRSNSPADTRSLSIMAQSIGYVMAAFSPALLGVAFDISSDWILSLLIAAALSLGMGLVGLKAGSSAKITA
jgi:CP family cyanate transporter-like MFS transporter